MEKLSEKQARFARMLGSFLVWASAQPGVGLTFAEAYRPPELARLYAEQGRGIRASLHCKRLAVDLNLFVFGEYISEGDHPMWFKLGDKWESMGGSWGGRFRNRDSNHFSLAHGGVK